MVSISNGLSVVRNLKNHKQDFANWAMFFGPTGLIAMALHLLNMHKSYIKLCEVRVFGGELMEFWCTFLLLLKISIFVNAIVGFPFRNNIWKRSLSVLAIEAVFISCSVINCGYFFFLNFKLTFWYRLCVRCF